jgi:[FeFe] hydrogenase (group B1/B3)
MRKFESTVEMLKHKVLTEVAKGAFEGTLEKDIFEIPKRIRPGKKATMRCCIYKERAILQERVKLAMGGNKQNSNVIEVIDIACDECPMGGYSVTDSCRGCIAHYCKEVCKKDAITHDDNLKASIDKNKCINCGLCAKVCPYNAISNHIRPCEKACFPKAISPGKDEEATIDNNKCIACGACISKCPFGAIMDKSFILDTIDILKNKESQKYKVYALIAPSIAGQFDTANYSQIVQSIKKLGFDDVFEVALGADMAAYEEALELSEKKFLTSSCCPAFVRFVETKYPDLKEHISHNLSPAGTIGKYIKEKTQNTRLIFIGPCVAKKAEFQKENVKKYIELAITYEELQALFEAKGIEVSASQGDTANDLKDASYYGRVFARSGGLTEAVAEALQERNLKDFNFSPIACSGIEECNAALFKRSKNVLKENFIEGMVCSGGCVNGPACIFKSAKNTNSVNTHANEASKNMTDIIKNTRI